MIPLSWYLILAAAMVCIGLYGVLARKNAIAMLSWRGIDLECSQCQCAGFLALLDVIHAAGQVFVVIVITTAAAEVAVGLAIFIAVYRKQKTIVTEEIASLKG